jgi:hypothetical protein
MATEHVPGGAPPKKDNTLFWIILGGAGCLFLGGIPVIAIIAAIAIPNLIEARKNSNEAAAIGVLRTVTTAQVLYREGDKDKDGVLQYAPDLESLRRTQLIDAQTGSGMRQGYRFQIEQADGRRFSATAAPAAPGKSGDRWFFVDESGVVRWSTRAPATAQDAPLGR